MVETLLSGFKSFFFFFFFWRFGTVSDVSVQRRRLAGGRYCEELFPWHEPPRANTSDAAVHQRMLELAKSPLIPNLTANFEGSFPGGSHFALQILAFFASWLRLRHCPAGTHTRSAPVHTLN